MHPLFRELIDSYQNEDYVPDPDITITQHNLVLVVNYGKVAPLIAKYCQFYVECRRSMETFPCLMKRFRYPGVTLMGFPSGQHVYVGGYNYPSTLFVALRHRVELEEFRRAHCPEVPAADLVFGSPHKANLVFTIELPEAPFDLARASAEVPGIKYEPKSFPGANTTLLGDNGQPLATVVFFEGGLANLMGCKAREDARKAVHILRALLRPYTCAPRENRENIVGQREREKQEALENAQRYILQQEVDAIPLDELLRRTTGDKDAADFEKALFADDAFDDDFDLLIT